jgi:hypothetical protein
MSQGVAASHVAVKGKKGKIPIRERKQRIVGIYTQKSKIPHIRQSPLIPL